MSLTYSGYTTVEERSRTVVAVTGEIDLYTAPDLKHDLHTALQSSAGALIIDLSRTGFIDSTGIGVLLGVLRRLKEDGRSLVLVVATRPIARVFTVTGLDKAFILAGSVEEARRLLDEPD